MRLLSMYLCLFLWAGSVLAEAGGAAWDAAEPARAEAVVPARQEAPQVLPDSGRLRKLQLQGVPAHIGLLRATVKATAVEKGFFSSLFAAKNNPADADLLLEMDSFIARFSELEETAELYHLKAEVYERTRAYPAAALSWLMLMAAYPDSLLVARAKNGLKELSEDPLKKHAAQLKLMADTIAALHGDRDHRVAAFLLSLGTLREADFAAPIAAECAAFLLRNRSYLEEDRIEHALAHQQASHEVAIYHFNKLLELYPDSTLRPDSLLSIGLIRHKELKLYDQAAESYRRVVEIYPDSDEARRAYESLGYLYDEDLRDYPNAIKTYETIVARYNRDPVVLRGLLALARIYQDKTNQPMQAIATYRKLDEAFRGKDGLEGLVKAEKLAFYTLRDWNLTLEINDRILKVYPSNDEAGAALYANAQIHEDKLKEPAQAIKLYSMLIDRYPNHELSKEAKRRIAALQQK